MRTAFAVIGVGFGDEGKGLVTDWITRYAGGMSPLVARGNGGAQAGHTVETNDGKRHVFSHVGAGTFAGADTYLGSQFIMNPDILNREMNELKHLGFTPKIYANSQCRVTTVYDMAINSLAELSRGVGRHGSCGMGINETVTRHDAGYDLTIGALMGLSVIQLDGFFREITDKWRVARLADLRISGDTFIDAEPKVQEKASLYQSMFQIDRINLINEMRRWVSKHVIILDKYHTGGNYMVLEGAQGLGLDEELGEFPYVTRSKTGLPYLLQAAAECGFDSVTPIYVTRSYTTRHGEGRLPYSGAQITEKDIPFDKTNVTNQWQGSLRLAPLNLDNMKHLIGEDLMRADRIANKLDITIETPKLAVTCTDHLGDHVTIVRDGSPIEIESRSLLRAVESYMGLSIALVSSGPTATDVHLRNSLI